MRTRGMPQDIVARLVATQERACKPELLKCGQFPWTVQIWKFAEKAHFHGKTYPGILMIWVELPLQDETWEFCSASG